MLRDETVWSPEVHDFKGSDDTKVRTAVAHCCDKLGDEGSASSQVALVYYVQFGATVLRTAFRIVAAVPVGVRRDCGALAVTILA